MSIETMAAFAVAFLLLALVPGAGLATIVSRTLGSGLAAGFAVTTGLVIGDFIFMGVALIGLSAIAATMGPVFQIVKYAGAAYLIWLGWQALRAAAAPIEVEAREARSFWREVGVGLLVTLGNPKPILFYGALMPTLLDVSNVSIADCLILGGIVVVISYIVYGGYMLMADRARRMIVSAGAIRRLNRATGAMFIGSGLLVATR